MIGDVRGGAGLMCGIEYVADRATKRPLDGAAAAKLQDAIWDDGVMARISGPNMILLPPLIISEDEIAKVLSAIETGLKAL